MTSEYDEQRQNDAEYAEHEADKFWAGDEPTADLPKVPRFVVDARLDLPIFSVCRAADGLEADDACTLARTLPHCAGCLCIIVVKF